MNKSLGAVAAAAAIAISLSACGGGGSTSATAGEAKGEINYWLWDSNQLPAYKECAADFTKANPDIKVKITQRGLGRLLDHADQRVCRRHRSGRLHQPPFEVPRTRREEAAAGPR